MSDSMMLLQEMVETPGIAGRESQICQFIARCAKETGMFDDITIDALGNLVCRRGARQIDRQSRRVLVVAHMDQCGFFVSYIDDDGTIKLQPVGTCDTRTLASQPVWVVSASGERIPGHAKLAARPIHTASTSEIKQQMIIDDFYIDLSQNVDWVNTHIAVGDMVVYRGSLEKVGCSMTGSGLDDRVGCWAMIESLPLLNNPHDELFYAFSVQEELGSRGVAAVCATVEPDLAVVCETVVSSDTPGVRPRDRVTVPGNGISIQIADSSMISDSTLVEGAEKALTEANIPWQRSLMSGGGQDGAIIQKSGRGVKTIALGCPLKYMHTPHEYVDIKDLQSYPVTIATLVNNL